jgi:protein-disulfide isomerase
MKTNKSLLILSILALLGLAFGIQLTQHYYEIRSGLAGFHSFCNINSQMNCDVVAASPAADFIAGFPLSSFTVGWYIALFIITLLGRDRFWFRETARAIFLMGAVGVAFSAIYFAIMAFTIHTYCLFCLGIDAVNVLVLAFAFSLKPEGTAVQKPEKAKWKSMAGTLVASVLVAVIALKVCFDNVSISSADISEKAEAALSMPVMPISVSDTDPSFGPKNAPVTIVEFSDFQCPYCRLGAMILKSVQDRYRTQVRIVFRPFPLDQACNRSVTHPMHQSACEAAKVALCARDQGKFQTVYEDFFENQTDIVPGAPAKMAEKDGVASDKLAACVANPATESELIKGIEEGILLNIDSTPTFFINGHRVGGTFPGPFWDKMIESLLKKP